jgi:hypothetical protein
MRCSVAGGLNETLSAILRTMSRKIDFERSIGIGHAGCSSICAWKVRVPLTRSSIEQTRPKDTHTRGDHCSNNEYLCLSCIRKPRHWSSRSTPHRFCCLVVKLPIETKQTPDSRIAGEGGQSLLTGTTGIPKLSFYT